MSEKEPGRDGATGASPTATEAPMVFRPVAAAGGFVYQLPDGRRLARDVMERLADAGMLSRVFSERVNVCPGCGSTTVIYREVCPKCQGAGIEQPEVIHHFPCAGVFRVELFGDPNNLVCPKCRKQLRHVGVDHEYTRGEFVCHTCGHASSVLPTSGRCLDCGAQFPADESVADDWYEYVPTELWSSAALGIPLAGRDGRPLPKILIVDDIADNLDLLEDMFEEQPLRMVRAASGQEALDLLARESFDLVILDINMPNMDGFDVARRMRTMEQHTSVPIIFLTAILTTDNDLLTGLEAGANDYVNKPVDRDDLLARVDEMLRRGNAARR